MKKYAKEVMVIAIVAIAGWIAGGYIGVSRDAETLAGQLESARIRIAELEESKKISEDYERALQEQVTHYRNLWHNADKEAEQLKELLSSLEDGYRSIRAQLHAVSADQK